MDLLILLTIILFFLWFTLIYYKNTAQRSQIGGDCGCPSMSNINYPRSTNIIGKVNDLPFPQFRKYWYRNYGEVPDPFFPNYWQTYWDDSQYFADHP